VSGARGSRPAAARAVRSARLSVSHEPDTHDDPRRLSADFCPRRAFPREDVRWECARVHVRVRVLYMISYRVHVTKLHDRRIHKVRVGVGVGPMEF